MWALRTAVKTPFRMYREFRAAINLLAPIKLDHEHDAKTRNGCPTMLMVDDRAKLVARSQHKLLLVVTPLEALCQ